MYTQDKENKTHTHTHIIIQNNFC